jgi:hypothetical protein
LIPGAGFDTYAAWSNWIWGAGGTSWNGSDDAEGCASSGSVSFTAIGSMQYCYASATGGATYYLGMKGKGNIGCLGQFYSDTTCTTADGYNFLNLAPTDSSTWQDTSTMGVATPSTTRSILVRCFSNGSIGAIDQIYLNKGSSTGFGG